MGHDRSFKVAVRKTRKNNNNPNPERKATMPRANRSGGARKSRTCEKRLLNEKLNNYIAERSFFCTRLW